MIINGVPKFAKPENSPFISFERYSESRKKLNAEISKLRGLCDPIVQKNRGIYQLPIIVGGRKIYTTEKRQSLVPHKKGTVLAEYSLCNKQDVSKAIEGVLKAREGWAKIPWFMKLHIFWTAAELLEKKYIYKMTAAVMEEFSKNPFEAFIDVQELIDFWRFNVYYAQEIYKEQPDTTTAAFNMLDHRPLEGFVFAVPPNNFIAIGGNLPTAPLLMGNVVVTKPSRDVTYCFHLVMDILFEAGLPMDVIAVLHGDSSMIGETVLNHPELSGIHFTGGTDTFNSLVKKTGENVDLYKDYTRLVGETGGKDFIVIFDDADLEASASAIVVGGFGYQGQKCSATSRIYVRQGTWAKLEPILLKLMDEIKVGDVADYHNFMGAIINEKAFRQKTKYIDAAKADPNVRVVGGKYDDTKGWFIHPTLIITDKIDYVTVEEELFAPIVTICTLPDETPDSAMTSLCDLTSPYALTGAVHTGDVGAFCEATNELRYAAGNFYNWKTTGAMVGKQPFGGARKSGTAGKVGWIDNLRKWTSPRAISLMTLKPSSPFPPCLDK